MVSFDILVNDEFIDTRSRAMLHDESIYERPEEFIPERFIPSEDKPKAQDPRAAAFGFGRRYISRYSAEHARD